MTLSELSYNIKNLAASGQGNNDDSTLTIRQVEFWIRAYRAKGILNITDYGKNIDPQMVQDLGVIPLLEVDAADSNCPKVEWGCKIKKIELPKLVDFPYNRGLLFVGKIDKRSPFILDSSDVSIFKESTAFGKQMSRCYLVGNTMYIKLYNNDVDMKYINVRGVFEDPTKVYEWPTEGCTPKCYDPMKDEYPMPLSMYEYVTGSIMQKELNMIIQTKEDETSNAKDEQGVENPIKG
tara:strand:- start:6069 stop:6776 length:708 start_codon:yes stop_codon:yes gene_type:complete